MLAWIACCPLIPAARRQTFISAQMPPPRPPLPLSPSSSSSPSPSSSSNLNLLLLPFPYTHSLSTLRASTYALSALFFSSRLLSASSASYSYIFSWPSSPHTLPQANQRQAVSFPASNTTIQYHHCCPSSPTHRQYQVENKQKLSCAPCSCTSNTALQHQ